MPTTQTLQQPTPTLLDIQRAAWDPYRQALKALHAEPSFSRVQEVQGARQMLVDVLSLPDTTRIVPVEVTSEGMRVVG